MDRDELIGEIYEALSNAQDMDTSLTDYARAVVRGVPLVAAAPDLLAALEHCRDVLSSMHRDGWKVAPDALAGARAAIAKANGVGQIDNIPTEE